MNCNSCKADISGTRSSELIKSEIKEGNLSSVRELIGSYRLSFTHEKSDGCEFLSLALLFKRTEMAKFLASKGRHNRRYKVPFDTPLHKAVEYENVEVIHVLLDRHVIIDAINSFGRTALHIAAGKGNLKIAKLLLDHGADINAKEYGGGTPLFDAIYFKNYEIIELFLIHGANVHAEMYFSRRLGNTPLHVAAFKGDEKVTEVLLKNGAHSNAKAINCVTPLHMAAQKGHTNIIEVLLKYKADINSMSCSKDFDGYTPLHCAINEGQNEAAELLLNLGANVNAQGKTGLTVLQLAIALGNSSIVAQILKHCPDMCNKNKEALAFAVHWSFKTRCNFEDYDKIFESLIQHGFTLDFKNTDNIVLLSKVIKNKLLKSINHLLKWIDICVTDPGYAKETIVKLLRRRGAAVYQQNIEEASLEDSQLLHTAAHEGYDKILEVLLEHGFDVNARDKNNLTPLHTAVKIGDEIICKMLLKFGADVNAKDTSSEETALHIASREGHENCLKYLVKYNADVNVRDKELETPLHVAALNGNIMVVKMLLTWDVDINSRRKDCLTALHLAVFGNHKEVVELLLKSGAEVNAKSCYYMTPLHFAASHGHEEIVLILLKFKAHIDSKNVSGHTSLHFACWKNLPKIVAILLENGSDINITDYRNKTPLTAAIESFCLEGASNKVIDHGDNYYLYCQVLSRILKKHIIKLKVGNLYVSKQNNEAIYKDKRDMQFYEKECVNEIKHMKIEKVGFNHISYNILKKDMNELTVWLGNPNNLMTLTNSDINEKFPIYGSMIARKLSEGIKRKELLEQSMRLFKSMFCGFPRLPDDCIENIFCYFCTHELENFVMRKGIVSLDKSHNINDINAFLHARCRKGPIETIEMIQFPFCFIDVFRHLY